MPVVEMHRHDPEPFARLAVGEFRVRRAAAHDSLQLSSGMFMPHEVL